MNIGEARKLVVFDPPDCLANGEDYAFFLPGDGQPQLWLVEQSAGDRWHWLRKARRVGVNDNEATRH